MRSRLERPWPKNRPTICSKKATMTFGEHLEELRVCLFRGVVGIVAWLRGRLLRRQRCRAVFSKSAGSGRWSGITSARPWAISNALRRRSRRSSAADRSMKVDSRAAADRDGQNRRGVAADVSRAVRRPGDFTLLVYDSAIFCRAGRHRYCAAKRCRQRSRKTPHARYLATRSTTISGPRLSAWPKRAGTIRRTGQCAADLEPQWRSRQACPARFAPLANMPGPMPILRLHGASGSCIDSVRKPAKAADTCSDSSSQLENTF